ncbi:MAG TPA: glycosyltransferase [Labilithrix sp.]|jgi:glycosyltransferase involved in cell wall biosynthesis|nr:glycosyltransferase [Labilithrix sp.]
MFEVAFAVPCYNEENRLDCEQVLCLAKEPGIHVVLVDDGSRDGTRRILEDLAARSPRSVTALALEANRGKAEAVRQGMNEAVRRGARFIGFADADFATPPDELVRIGRIASEDDADVLMGARIAMAGTDIQRHPSRHYLGRVFSTAASLALDARFYDTQCGAKVFRNTPLFRAAIGTPFESRWIFDVELLARLLTGVDGQRGLPFRAFREVPLLRWTDVGHSRVRVRELTGVGKLLLRIARRVRAHRALHTEHSPSA